VALKRDNSAAAVENGFRFRAHPIRVRPRHDVVAWTWMAIYGFLGASRRDPNPLFLATAHRIADYALEKSAAGCLCRGTDFADEGGHFRSEDPSAAAMIAGGLFAVHHKTTAPSRDAARYRDGGETHRASLIDRY